MLDMIAAAVEDGWAFVRRGNNILLIKPPYLQSNMLAVSEDTVEKAITRHGFASVEKHFHSWGDLITFLKNQLIATRKEQGLAEPRTELIRELVEFAPLYMLKSYLDRAKNELIPNREWNACLNLLTAIMGLETVRVNSELYNYAVEVLENCQQHMHNAETNKLGLLDEEYDLTHQFPNIVQKYGAGQIIAAVNHVQKVQSLWF
jgi:hypothetical protein